MSPLLEHVFLFVAASAVVVVMSAFYAERDDAAALRSVPRRLAVFLGTCAVVAVVLLACEHFFAGVG